MIDSLRNGIARTLMSSAGSAIQDADAILAMPEMEAIKMALSEWLIGYPSTDVILPSSVVDWLYS